MKIQIKKRRMQSVVEVVETIELPKLPHYYYNNDTRQFVRVLGIFSYGLEKGCLSTDEKDIYALDITIVPEQTYGWELKIQRFKISISNFSHILSRGLGLACDTLSSIISPSDCYSKTEEEFNKEMEVAVFRITEPSCNNAKEKDSGHP
jgi:hypothetical protein